MKFLKPKKKRKPRGKKLDGSRSMDMCPYCYAFNCDPMMRSRKWDDKVRSRLARGLCPSCGASPCKCKSSLSAMR